MNCNTAIFYDVENLLSLYNGGNHKTLKLDEILARVTNLDYVSGVSVQRAYADWIHPLNRSLRTDILQIGIEPIQIFNTNQDRVKNAADVCLIIDALELLIKRPEIENFCIASGDGIFAFLAKKLHEYGKRVIAVGYEKSSNIYFMNACDIFVPLDKSEPKGAVLVPPEKELRVQIHSDSSTVAETKPEPPAPVLKNINKLPRNKFTEKLAHANLPILKKGTNVSDKLHHMKKILNTLFSLDKDAEVEMSVFKQYSEHYVPSFREEQYGFKRFGEFMRFFLTASPYRLAMDGTIVKIVKREHKAPGAVLEDMKGLKFTDSAGNTYDGVFDIDGGSFTFEIAKHSQAKSAAAKTLYVKPIPIIDPPDKSAADKFAPDEPAAETVKGVPASEDVQGVPLPVAENARDIPAAASENVPDSSSAENSIRKWIKEHFSRLSKDNKLSAAEAKRLTAAKYSADNFSTKVPVFKAVDKRSTVRKQRMVNGKFLYWSEVFVFKGKEYLVYKEWIDRVHRKRFAEWLAKVDK